MKFLLLLIAASSCVASKKVSYRDYQVFRMFLKTDEELAFVKNLVESCEGCSLWSLLSTQADNVSAIMVAPSHVEEFIAGMNKSSIAYEKYIDDVQKLIEHNVGGDEKNFGWTRYHTLEEIYCWLDSLAEKYPGNVETIIAGRTYEGRVIKGAKISFRNNNPGVFIECGIHSHEWIATATGTYLINQLLTSKDPAVRELAESHDWYIFPSFNPDGYVYAHEVDRMWGKTRSPQDSGCYGVDPNRNWDYMWKVTTNDSCNSKYGGSMGFSEIETRTTSEYISSLQDKLFAYISFHSFRQLLMVPYGYTAEHMENYNETMAIARKAVKSLERRYQTKYLAGSIPDLEFIATGTSIDWVKGVLKLPLVYLYELRDRGDYGLLLPREEIIPNCEEILDSLVTMFKEAKKFGYPKQQ